MLRNGDRRIGSALHSPFNFSKKQSNYTALEKLSPDLLFVGFDPLFPSEPLGHGPTILRPRRVSHGAGDDLPQSRAKPPAAAVQLKGQN
jgi:hypothetical protein